MSQPDDDAPPSYSSHDPLPSSSISSHPLTAHLESHLSHLPTLIRDSQAAHSSAQTASDLALLSRVIPHIETLLHRLATMPRPPALAELILVPATPVLGWAFSADRSKRDELVRLVRVGDPKADGELAKTHEKGSDKGYSGDGDGSSDGIPDPEAPSAANSWQTSAEFDDWGRWGDDKGGRPKKSSPDDWWWSNESMAIRLAKHLNPRPEPREQPPPPSPAPVEPEKKRSRWSSFFSPAAPRPVTDVLLPTEAPTKDKGPEMATMTVRAEEITFRRENEFGVWESRNGFGLVVKVRTRA